MCSEYGEIEATTTTTKPYFNQKYFNQLNIRANLKFNDKNANVTLQMTVPLFEMLLEYFMCFPFSGTKLLCVTESIISFIRLTSSFIYPVMHHN